MNSCDTFVLSPTANVWGQNVAAKNSDRPIGEVQTLIYTPAKTHEDVSPLRCTYIEIPQVQQTYAAIGSKPYWMWGYEMAVNEKGVFIANEAQGSRIAENGEENALLGMDLLRLGVERADSAKAAVNVIADLLEQYGQNANASQLFDRRYENSFFIVDPHEIWLMETAGRLWAARRITEQYAAISNCYTIETDYDMAAEGIVKIAREKDFISEGEELNFAKAFTMPAVRQTIALPRWRRMLQLLHKNRGKNDLDAIKKILRDHYEGEIIAPRDGWGAGYGTIPAICMHAMTWDSSQTTASMIVRHDRNLGPVIRYAFSIPCCSVYLPIYMTGNFPVKLACGDGLYDYNSLWWRFERLAMAVSADYENNHQKLLLLLQGLEKEIEATASGAEAIAEAFIRDGKKELAYKILNEFMDKTINHVEQFLEEIYPKMNIPLDSEGEFIGYRKEFLSDYCKRTQLIL